MEEAPIARGVSFPAVFSDGETQIDIGNVVVNDALEFKLFLSLLSNKIGMSPRQFTVFLSSPDTRRRIPITSKVNFGEISSENNCFFLVKLKRSRRERRRSKNCQIQHHHHQDFKEDEYDNSASSGLHNPVDKSLSHKSPSLENVMLIRRGTEIENFDRLGFSFAGRAEYKNRFSELQMVKERYLMNMGLGRSDGLGLELGRRGGVAVACEECSRARDMDREVGFHRCAYDPVTFGFRSSAGPISRPAKGSG